MMRSIFRMKIGLVVSSNVFFIIFNDTRSHHIIKKEEKKIDQQNTMSWDCPCRRQISVFVR